MTPPNDGSVALAAGKRWRLWLRKFTDFVAITDPPDPLPRRSACGVGDMDDPSHVEFCLMCSAAKRREARYLRKWRLPK